MISNSIYFQSLFISILPLLIYLWSLLNILFIFRPDLINFVDDLVRFQEFGSKIKIKRQFTSNSKWILGLSWFNRLSLLWLHLIVYVYIGCGTEGISNHPIFVIWPYTFYSNIRTNSFPILESFLWLEIMIGSFFSVVHRLKKSCAKSRNLFYSSLDFSMVLPLSVNR